MATDSTLLNYCLSGYSDGNKDIQSLTCISDVTCMQNMYILRHA